MSFNYTIKKMESDSVLVSDAMHLVWNVFSEFEAPEYSQEGIGEFQNFIAVKTVQKRMVDNELFLWACFDQDNIVGVIASKPACHIALMFVDKAYHRRGIAKHLYSTVLNHYRANSNYHEMTVNSSPYAVEIYHKLGFIDTNTEQTVNGLRFTPMKHVFR